MLKFIAAGDMHWGYESRYVGNGKIKRTPSHALAAIRPFMQFVADFKPDVFALMGDQMNCGPVSRHALESAKIQELENMRLDEELKEFDTEFLSPIEKMLPKKARRIWLDGNHEAWADLMVSKQPGIEGMIEPRNKLRLAERGWEVYPSGHILKLGKWRGTHGDVVLARRAGMYPATTALNQYGSTIRIWHTHQKQFVAQTVMAKEGYRTGACVPGLCDRGPGYLKNAPNRYQHGFCFGYIFDDGYFDDSIKLIWKGRFVVDGKVYK